MLIVITTWQTVVTSCLTSLSLSREPITGEKCLGCGDQFFFKMLEDCSYFFRNAGCGESSLARSLTQLELISVLGLCTHGAVVRVLASYQCDPGSIPRLGVICGLSLSVLYSAQRGFLQVLRFPLSSKTNI